MLKKLGLAVCLTVAAAGAAAAQSVTLRFGPQPPPSAWREGHHPYARQHHDTCQRKAWRLNQYERHASSDGRLSWRERRELNELRNDLDRTCGRWRWRG